MFRAEDDDVDDEPQEGDDIIGDHPESDVVKAKIIKNHSKGVRIK
jgi:hypothetical protein